MTANVFLNKIIGRPGITTYSKYSEFLYGLATGGQGWAAIHLEHPEMTESDAIKLSINIILKEPNLLIKGIAKSYSDYFAPVNGGFSFLRLIYVQNNTPDRILWILFGIGLITAFIKRKQGNYGLILVSYIGIFLSLAAVPPTEADDMRIYAVTMPFIFYTTATSVVLVDLVFKKYIKFHHEKEESKAPIEILEPFTIGMLALCLLGPLAIMATHQTPKYKSQPSCSSDEEKIYFRIGNQSSITIRQDYEMAESYMPNIRVSDFRNGVVTGPIYTFYPRLDQALLNLIPGQTLNLVTYLPPPNSNSEDFSGYLVTNGQVLPSGFYAGCGIKPTDNTEIPWFFYKGPQNSEPAKTFFIPQYINSIRIIYGLILLCVFFAAMIDTTAFQLMSWKKRLLLLGNIAIILSGILIYLHSEALFPLSWQRTSLKENEAIPAEGYAYQIPLGISWMNQKSVRQPPVIVYENGIPLENPNAKIYAVKHLGQGRFLVQSGYLYVSASDNSDPRVNGRKYEIEWPTPIRARYQFAIYSLALIGILIHVKYFTTASSQTNITQTPLS
jgi:hypothetical protein